jgi:hypothetical protein
MPAHQVIVLDMRGKKMASSKMARYIRELDLDGVHGMVFVIGGSNGLSRRVMERADLLLSFLGYDLSPSANAPNSSGTDLPMVQTGHPLTHLTEPSAEIVFIPVLATPLDNNYFRY